MIGLASTGAGNQPGVRLERASDALLTRFPDEIGIEPTLGAPPCQLLAVPRLLVCSDLVRDDGLFMEHLQRTPARRVWMGQVNAFTPKAEVAMCLGDAREAALPESLSNAGRVDFLHVEQAEHQPDAQTVLLAERRQERVLAAAGASAFGEDPLVCRGSGGASVGEVVDEGCCSTEGGDPTNEKSTAKRPFNQ